MATFKYILIFLAVILLSACGNGVVEPATANDSFTIRVDTLNISAKRAQLKQMIFGSTVLPTGDPDSITDKWHYTSPNTGDTRYAWIPNLKQIKYYRLNLSPDECNPGIVRTLALHLYPKVGNGKLAILHQGHASPEWMYGIGDTSAALIGEGYDVLIMTMPGVSPNESYSASPCNVGGAIPLSAHDRYRYFESPMKMFFQQIPILIDYVTRTYGFTDISMVGLSGGGWTTVIYSALDTRIKRSFPVAGTVPLRYRFKDNKNLGDWEQMDYLFRDFSYVDLYTMAGDSGRFQLAFWIWSDSCCFPAQHAAQFGPGLRAQIQGLGFNWDYMIDTTNTTHQISQWTINQIMAHINLD